MAGACVVVIERSVGRGDGVRGLSDWVVVGCGVVVVGGVIAVGRVGGSRLSVVELTCVAVVGVAWVMWEGGGGGGTDFSGVGGEEGVGGVGVVVGSCGFRSGESLAEFFPLRALRVHSMGLRRVAEVEE